METENENFLIIRGGNCLTPKQKKGDKKMAGGNMQYTQKFGTIRVKKNEQVTSWPWYKFLLWALGVGGVCFLAWVWFSGVVVGYRLGTSETGIPATSTKIEVSGLEKTETALEVVAE